MHSYYLRSFSLSLLRSTPTKKRLDVSPTLQIKPRTSVHKSEIKHDVCPKEPKVAPEVPLEHVEASCLCKGREKVSTHFLKREAAMILTN